MEDVKNDIERPYFLDFHKVGTGSVEGIKDRQQLLLIHIMVSSANSMTITMSRINQENCSTVQVIIISLH